MIELDLEQIILKPIVLRPLYRQVIHRMSLNCSPIVGPFLFCFYFIAHRKGPIERDRIGFGANYFETYQCQTPPPPPTRQTMHRSLLNIEVP